MTVIDLEEEVYLVYAMLVVVVVVVQDVAWNNWTRAVYETHHGLTMAKA